MENITDTGLPKTTNKTFGCTDTSAPLVDSGLMVVKKEYVDNIDAWIKQIRREFAEISDVAYQTWENRDNIQHNYELIYELRDEVTELKLEIDALKLIQIISLQQLNRLPVLEPKQ